MMIRGLSASVKPKFDSAVSNIRWSGFSAPTASEITQVAKMWSSPFSVMVLRKDSTRPSATMAMVYPRS